MEDGGVDAIGDETWGDISKLPDINQVDFSGFMAAGTVGRGRPTLTSCWRCSQPACFPPCLQQQRQQQQQPARRRRPRASVLAPAPTRPR